MKAKKQENVRDFFQILIAPDKFKGSLTSALVAKNIKKGVLDALLDNKLISRECNKYVTKANFDLDRENDCVLLFDTVEIADGGDGSAEIFKKQVKNRGCDNFKEVMCEATNPVGEQISTSYSRNGKTAFIEMAKISGLELLSKAQQNPLHTTTFGFGELILHALNGGAEEIILAIGGSATNDGGTGMLQALGFQFFEASGIQIPAPYMCGKELERIALIQMPKKILVNSNGEKASLKIVCDVVNPLLGENGATWVYGAQKGADIFQQKRLEAGMTNYVQAKVLFQDICKEKFEPESNASFTAIQSAVLPGAGAAGGVGFAATYYLGGELISGWRFFAQLTRLEERIASCDLVISGEGRIDSQSFQGKVIDGVSILAKKHQKPLLLFCGVSELSTEVLLPNTYIYTLSSLEPNKERSMIHAQELLSVLAAKAIKEFKKEKDRHSIVYSSFGDTE